MICVDREIVGEPISKEDGCTICNWLSSAVGDIERQIIEELNRLDEEARN